VQEILRAGTCTAASDVYRAAVAKVAPAPAPTKRGMLYYAHSRGWALPQCPQADRTARVKSGLAARRHDAEATPNVASATPKVAAVPAAVPAAAAVGLSALVEGELRAALRRVVDAPGGLSYATLSRVLDAAREVSLAINTFEGILNQEAAA